MERKEITDKEFKAMLTLPRKQRAAAWNRFVRTGKSHRAMRLAEEMAGHLREPLVLLRDNLRRVDRILSIYTGIHSLKTRRPAPRETDLLRLAVVFLHATIEEYLRSVARNYLWLSNEEVMNRIPLIGLNIVGRAEKFFLGKLVHHREKRVNDLLRESVSEYLLRLSFNDTTDIITLLTECDLKPTKELRSMLPNINEIMQRRHRIVHNADRTQRKSRSRKTNYISINRVDTWRKTVFEFAREVLAIILAHEISKKQSKLYRFFGGEEVQPT